LQSQELELISRHKQLITNTYTTILYIMGLHIPSFLVGSLFAGSGFLLIHRELSHRRRLTTKWIVQEYAEESWREWRKSSTANQIEDAKVSMHVCL